MTREQLDAIRARVEAAKTEEGWEPVHTIHKKNYVDDTYTGFQACCPIVFCGEYGNRSSDDANELSYAHMDLIGNAPADITALLAEVERLREAAVWEEDQVHRMVTNAHLRGAQETRERMRAEVERLTADPLPAAAWVREERDAAFKRGVAAMRVAALNVIDCDETVLWCHGDLHAERILALPDPEDKS